MKLATFAVGFAIVVIISLGEQPIPLVSSV